MEDSKKDKWIDRIVFLILLVGVSAVTLFLFNKQTHGNPGAYHSDMKAYILEMQGLDSGYSFPYPVFFKFAAFLNLFFPEPEFAVAAATMILNSLAILIFKCFLNRMFRKRLYAAVSQKTRWLCGIFLSVISVALFFVSMLYKKGGIYHLGINFIYLGVFTPNPFHNATYLAARPFALLSFFFFVFLLPRYENGCSGHTGSLRTAFFDRKDDEAVDLTEYLLFSVSLLFSTMTKPSFTIILAGAAGVLMLYRFIRNFFTAWAHERAGRNFKANFGSAFALGLCFIPTFLDLLYQYQGVFVPAGTEEGGIGFEPGKVWNLYCGCIPAAILLACGFPICVLVFNYREIRKNEGFRFSWLLYWVGFASAYLFYEKGFRWADFNFSWGYEYGIFFCFVGALSVLIPATFHPEKTKIQKIALVIQWLVFLAHLICGILYFGRFLRGEMYY